MHKYKFKQKPNVQSYNAQLKFSLTIDNFYKTLLQPIGFTILVKIIYFKFSRPISFLVNQNPFSKNR